MLLTLIVILNAVKNLLFVAHHIICNEATDPSQKRLGMTNFY
jgi:hypothetical protein